MSILIRGMEMPKGCFDCPFERDYAFICSLTNKETRKQRKEHDVNEYEAMPEWCPLVEVPTPHGRMIDADELISRQLTLEHIKKRLLETAINNVGIRALCDDIFVDIADNRIETWIAEVPSAHPEPPKEKENG